MKRLRGKIIKPLIIFITGLGLSAIFTWSAYIVNRNSIRSSEKQIVKDILFTMSVNIETTLDQVFMPDLIGYHDGEVSRELFTTLTNPSLELSSTSFSWIPLVKAIDRKSFVTNSSVEYPGYHIKIIDQTSTTSPRPIDDADIWPILHANPLFNEDLRGVDLKLFIGNDIERMIETRETVIGELFFIALFDNALKFSNENSVYNILQPVFNSNDEIIGSFNRLLFPSEIIIESLEGSGIQDVKNSQVSIFRTGVDGIEETVFVEDRHQQSDEFSSDIDFKHGKNKYTYENDIRHNKIVITMTSDTVPQFQSYGIIMCISIFSSVLVTIMCYLQIIVSDRNKVLAKDRKKALDIAIIESEHKTRFVSEMSHEFRTPLNGIMGMMDLIRSENISPTVRRYMAIAESCSTIMLGIVNDILDFSKIQSGKMSIVRCPVSIRTLMRETMDIMRVTYNKKLHTIHEKVILRLELKPSVPEGLSELDDTRVRQIIVNLVSNAFKFTHNGKITVKVECTGIDISGTDSTLHISVSDTGIGISPKGVNNLFKPFSQVHDPREINAGGTGLGLVICKNLCSAMGGDITCESVKGVGTVFSFNCKFQKPTDPIYTFDTSRDWDLSEPIELREDEEDEYIVDISPKPISDKIGACFTTRSSIAKKPSIIFADDVNVNRLILERMMAPLRVNISFAENGLELVNMCMAKKYSIILTDIVMPVMSGTEASRIISTGTGPNRSTPIIAISGTNDETGMTIDTITKPVARHLLYDKICKWLSNEEVTWIHQNWARESE